MRSRSPPQPSPHSPSPTPRPHPTLPPTPSLLPSAPIKAPPLPASPHPPPTSLAAVRGSPRLPETGLSQAEAYAQSHSRALPRPNAPPTATANNSGSKPIFEWLTRKLGVAGRRATISDGSPFPASTSATPGATSTAGRTTRKRMPSTPQVARPPLPSQSHKRTLSPIQIFHTPLQHSRSLAQSESMSLRSYSASPPERDRRREANNPYPSIPVPSPPLRDQSSTLDSESAAFSASLITRSRTPSIRSQGSDLPPRISFADDVSWNGAGGTLSARLRRAVSGTGLGGADDNASVLAIPPSHPASPTPSTSYATRSIHSAYVPTQRPTTIHSSGSEPGSGRRRSFSTSSSDAMGRDGRRDGDEGDEGEEGDRSRQGSTSTKPTTVRSFDSGPPVTHAHIAQAPAPPPPIALTSLTHPLGGSDSGPPTPSDVPTPSTASPASPIIPSAQAPKHTAHHPSDNPNPASPPDPNASTLTLASSNFALIPATPNPNPNPTPSLHRPSPLPLSRAQVATSPSVTFAMGRPTSYLDAEQRSSSSVYGPHGTSLRTGTWFGRDRERVDGDASVRAIRRKGSWESYESGWSWRPGGVRGDGAMSGASGSGGAREGRASWAGAEGGDGERSWDRGIVA